MHKFSYDKYVNYILQKKTIWDRDDLNYKNQYIPSRLYKYGSFKKRKYVDSTLENICCNRIWMPKVTTLNDPFEFSLFDYEDVNTGSKVEFRDEILNSFCVLSLTSSPKNYVMWSMYSDTHKGYCFEFGVTDSSKIYPVTYRSRQKKCSNVVNRMYKEKQRLLSSPIEELSGKDFALLANLQRILLYKKSEWSYENEFRIVERFDDNKCLIDGDGTWISLPKYGLKLERIILGCYCTNFKIKKVIGYVNNANSAVFDKYSRIFPLSSKDDIIKMINENGDFIEVAILVKKAGRLELTERIYPRQNGIAIDI